ncbi:MAG: hypothetical protein JWM27_2266 [Gemmatimonadetes bacterium]|nr:hypothetical protein [Gemmatimonadota bacterium]
MKFTEAGEVRVALAAADGAVSVRVADTGIGIAAENAGRVFDAFWQVDQSGSRQGGTGLGLAVARQLAVLLGGTVTLGGEPGGGSVFTLGLPTIPVETATPPAPAQPSAREKRVKGRRGPPRRGAKPFPTGGQGA